MSIHSSDTANRRYAPRYNESFTGVMICFALCFFLSQAIRFLLQRENRSRDESYGLPTTEHGLEDLSDKENTSFRYPL